MYHVELRQFPHNFCRFNLSEEQLREMVLSAWARGEPIKLGERSWDPRQAKLTVLEGPQIPVAQLSMGRGWRAASRESSDVTERVLGAQSTSVQRGEPHDSLRLTGDSLGLAGDSLGLEVLAQLGAEAVPVILAWRLARERYPQGSAGDCLKLAELAVVSLVRGGLLVLLRERPEGTEWLSSEPRAVAALLELESWTAGPASGSLLMMRAPVAQR